MKNILVVLRLLREGMVFAVNALATNRLRTLLSLLGITIGIFLIISVFTLVDSLELSIRKSFKTLGDESLFVEKMPWGPEEGGEYAWWKYMQRPDVTFSEAEKLANRMHSAGSVTFFASSSRTLTTPQNTLKNAAVVAVSKGYENFIPVEIAEGRRFSDSELKSSNRICILGHDVAARLFPTSVALGKTVKIAGYRARIIGVLEKKGQSPIGNNSDEWAIVPIRFGRQIMDFKHSQTQIALKPKPFVSFEAMENETRMHMRSIRRLRPTEDRNFAINKSSMLSSGLDSFFEFLTLSGFLIGGFSILVGGFSIANIMFVSVRERTAIIGIQKALGAKQRFILFQFLFESVALCLLGGSIGLLLIGLGVLVLNAFTTTFELVLTLENVGVGIGFSVAIGLVSGMLPAYLAARLEPVEAMRTTA